MDENIISIITPCYLRDELLMETIHSVCKQTYQNWELLLVDDACSESTKDLVLSIGDKRVKYISRGEEKSGAPVCRNIGIRAAMGHYLMFLDSDDMMSPNCLANRMTSISKIPDVDFLVFNSAFFQDSIIDAHVLWNRFDDRNDLERFLSADVVWHTSGSFFKTSAIKQNNLEYNEDALSGQDLFFHLDVLLKGLKHKKIDSVPDVFIRRNAAQPRISDTHADTLKVLNRISIMKKYINYEEIFNNQLYLEGWIKAVFTECINYIKSGRSLPKSYLLFPSEVLNDQKLKEILYKIKRANSLVRIHPLLNRGFHKVLKVNLSDGLNRQSLYRSEMTEIELADLLNSNSGY